MANSTRFAIPLPDVGASTDTWGTILNNAFSSLEQKVTDKSAGDTINGNLTINGTLSATSFGAVSAASVATAALSATGNATLGDAITDSHVITGRLDVAGPQQSNIVTAASDTLDLSQGNYFTRTINANATFVFNNPPTGKAFGFTLELNHTSGTVTWPASVVWPKNTAPTLTAGKTHLFTFVTDNAGATYRGAALVDYTT